MPDVKVNAHNPVEVRRVLESLQADNAAMRAAIVAITAKLDADGGVTDVNYASTCDPPALTTTNG